MNKLNRILIVEDDRIIRKSIVQIDWKSIGAEVVAEASNGKDALKLIDQHEPQLVITDINMPRMDGVVFSQNLRQSNPEIRIIFLSGYDDFEYLQNALQVQSDDYLLKPVSQEKLLASVEKAIAKWEDRSIERHQFEDAQLQLQSQKLRLFLFDMQPLSESLYHRFSSCFIKESAIIAVKIMEQNNGIPICQYIKRLIPNGRKEIIPLNETEAFVLTEDINCVKKELVLTSYKSTNIKDEETLREYLFNMWLNNKINSFDYDLVERDLSNDEINMIKNKIQSLLFDLEKSRLPLLDAKIQAIHLMVSMFLIYKREDLDHQNIYIEVRKANQLNHLKEIIEVTFEQWKTQIENAESSKKSVIVQAVEYLEEHFQNNTLSLTTLADEVFVSAPYLSQLFKTELNENFTDYLLKLRMERAKLLLSTTQYKNYEIAELVGYTNPHYFSSAFKKFTSFSPNEYKKLYKNN